MSSSSSSSERELEKQLEGAGIRLLEPPSLLDKLLPLLDQLESFLSRVEQSPSKSMLNALNPSIRALVADGLLRHSDIDVKVAVASCISEITRITAPDAPYDDDKMKDVFQLIVASFEKLSDMSSRSYSKRVLILETVAKVRSCVVMLDLECDELIIEMFQHFLKAIRDDHPENVFLSMVTIMTLVLEESEEVSKELLSPMLAILKRDEEIQTISRKLAEEVFKKCASKLKPYLWDSIKSLGISLNDFSEVVASVCEGITGSVEPNEDVAAKEQIADESKLATCSLDDPAQVPNDNVRGEAYPKEIDSAFEKPPKLLVSNGVAEVANDGTSVNSGLLKSSRSHDRAVNQIQNTKENQKAETADFNTQKVVSSESKPEKSAKRRGRKPISVTNCKEYSDTHLVENEKEPRKQRENQRRSSYNVCEPCGEDPSTEGNFRTGNGKAMNSLKALEREVGNGASPSASRSLPNERQPKKVGRPKKKENKTQEDLLSAGVSRKESKGTIDLEVKAKRSAKKVPSEVIDKRISSSEDISKNEGVSISNSEANILKQSVETVDGSNNIEDEFVSKKEGGKKRGRGKAALEKEAMKPTNDEFKEIASSPIPSTSSAKDEEHVKETPKSNPKRKRIPSNNRTPETVEYGENLVGSKIRVWWPMDHKFYDGVIESFIENKKKHKVIYNDGDIEELNLKKQRWEFIEDDTSFDVEQERDPQIPDDSSGMPRKKKTKVKSEPSSKHGKSRDRSTKPRSKSGSESVGKLKPQSHKSGSKPFTDVSKKAAKSKNVDSGNKSNKPNQGAPKTVPKSKQDTPQNLSKSKGKLSQGGNKSNVNGIGKVKSASLKVEEAVQFRDKSPEPAGTTENMKRKSTNTSKMQGSKGNIGKKR